MVLKIPGEIIIDDVAVAENLRLNVADRKGRLKCTTKKGDDVKQVDIAITKFECEKLISTMSWTATAVGIDMQSKLPIVIKFIYYKMKKICKIQLNRGKESREFKFESFEDSMKQVEKIIKSLS